MDMVGDFNPSEKYDFVNWDDDIPSRWKHKTSSEPPTSQQPQSYFNKSYSKL